MTKALPTSGSEAAEAAPLPSLERLQELLMDAARLGRDDMIPALLQAGAEIEAQDERDHTALVLASYHGHESTTALLLSLGALPDGQSDQAGNTALMGVAFRGHLAIARMLIRAGAEVDRRNRAGQTALMMAVLFGREAMVDMLLAAGADSTLRDGNGDTAADLARAQGNDPLAVRLETLVGSPA